MLSAIRRSPISFASTPRGRRARFHGVKWNTRRTYVQALEVLEAAAGDVPLREIKMATLQRWYRDARYPDGKGAGPDHLRKAHGLMSILRRAVGFGVASEIEGCLRLKAILDEMRFEQPKARKSVMEFRARREDRVRRAIDREVLDRDRHRAPIRVRLPAEGRDRGVGSDFRERRNLGFHTQPPAVGKRSNLGRHFAGLGADQDNHEDWRGCFMGSAALPHSFLAAHRGTGRSPVWPSRHR